MMDGEDGVLKKNGLREVYLTTDSDMWKNLDLCEGEPLYSRQILELLLLLLLLFTVLHLYCCIVSVVICAI
jgi:hypothetical protein